MLKFKDLREGKNPKIVHKEIFDLSKDAGYRQDDIVRYVYNVWMPQNMKRFDKEGKEVYIEAKYDFVTFEGPMDEHDHFSVPGPRSVNQAFVIIFWEEDES